MMPMLGSLDCCALAASGQPTAAPPTTLMNSRRLTQPSPTLSARPGTGLRLAHPEESGDGLRDKSLRDGPMSAVGHVWTAPWQELSDAAAALVGCGHVSVLFVRLSSRWPYCYARIGAQSKTRTLECADPNGFSRSPDRPYLHYVVVSSPIL